MLEIDPLRTEPSDLFLGWSYSILILTLLTLTPLVLILKYKRLTYKGTRIRKKAHFRDIITYFKYTRFRKWIPVLVLINVPTSILFYFIKRLLTDKGFSLEQTGFFFGIAAIGAAMLLGLLAGFWLKKSSDYRKLIIGVTGSVASVLSALMLVHGAGSSFYIALMPCIVIGSGTGLNTMIVFHMGMKSVRQGKEAADYALQTFLRSALFMVFIPIGVSLAGSYGYEILFYAMGGFCLALLLIININFRPGGPANTSTHAL